MPALLRLRKSVEPHVALRLAPVPPETLFASRVQEHLFPRQLPHLPGWDLAACCQPARTLAGDYLDVFDMGGGRVALALGDVSGKGLGPALVMAGVHALIRGCLLQRSHDLTGVIAHLNQYLLTSTPDDMFVTLFLAVVETATGSLRYVNAGHPAPLVLTGKEGAEVVRLGAGGPLLGVVPKASFDEGSWHLPPESLLAVFSDGVTEAASAADGQFQERRLLRVLQADWMSSAERLRKDVLKAVTTFTRQVEPADDLSLMLLRRDPASPARRRSGPAG